MRFFNNTFNYTSYALDDNEEKIYEYDEQGRVTRVTYADGSYVIYTYDKNGNIINTEYNGLDDNKTDTEPNSDSNNPSSDNSNDKNNTNETSPEVIR